MFEDACGNWNHAAAMGYDKASLQANKYCKDIVDNKPNSGPRPRPNQGEATGTSSSSSTTSTPKPTKPGNTVPRPTTPGSGPKPTKPGKPGSNGNTGSTGMDEPTRPDENRDEVIIEKPDRPVDNSVNEIVVDDDLTLIIRNGLGSRKLMQQPNILILADEGGTVAIDVVVNERGRIDSASLNTAESTLSTQSIISLATRKAKEFWFEKSDYDQMEGTILFVIAGR